MSLIREFIGWKNRPLQGVIRVLNPDGTVQVLGGTYEVNVYRHPATTPFATGTVAGGQLTVNGAGGEISLLFAAGLMTTEPGYGSMELIDISVAGGRVMSIVPLRILPQGAQHQPEYNERLILYSQVATVIVEPIDAGGAIVAEGGYGDVTVSGLGIIWTINPNVVSNGKLAKMAANTIKANITGALADPADVTRAAFVPWLDLQASEIETTPAGGLAATTVQASLTELDTEKLDKAGGTITGNLTIAGNLTLNGSTYQVNATTVTYDDIILIIGGDTAPVADDAKDRGVEFRWHNGAVAKLGYFGFDRSTQEFAFVPDATDTADVISGVDGTFRGNLNGNATSANIWATGRTISLTGQVTGVSGAFNGSANLSFATALANNTVTDAQLRTSAALTIIGRSANSVGNVADIAAANGSAAVLRESGGVLGFGEVATAGLANNAVTDAKLRTSAALTIVGRAANSVGNVADIAAAADGRYLGRRASALGFFAPDAAEIVNTPAGSIAATTVQAAINELDSEKLATAGGTISGNLTITGNLTLNGSTYQVNATQVTYDDIILVIGGDTAPVADDAKDRGVEFRWHNGVAAKIGYFGFDRSTQEFLFVPDATDTADVITGTAGTFKGNLNGNAVTASAWATGRTITLTGQVTGVSGAFDGSGNLSFATALGSFTMAQLDAAVSDGNVSYVGHTHNGLAPAGGATSHVLKKLSAADWDYGWVAESGGGSGISDGDYGDISVSGGGAVLSIDAGVVGTTEIADDAVTLAKLAPEVLQAANAALAADVTLNTANTWYDGPLISLTAGTWLVVAHAQFQKTTTTASQVTARISDGTTHYASQNKYHASLSGITLGFSMQTIVTLAAAADLKVQMAASVGVANNLMKAAAPNNGSGNNATQISAIRIA